jgi:hypothetical protein
LTVKRLEKLSAFLKRAKTIEPHGIQPFKNVAIFSMLRKMTVFNQRSAESPQIRP